MGPTFPPPPTREGFHMQPIYAVALIVATVLGSIGGTLLLLQCLDDVLTDWAHYKRNRAHRRHLAQWEAR